jgi:MraZ protein
MFQGQFKHAIDEKGRLSIPSKFREALASDSEALLYVTILGDRLVAYSADEWKRLEEQLNSMPRFNKKIRDFRRNFYSPAERCVLNKAGRILIPQFLRERAGLKRDVVLAGMGLDIEIWDAERFEAVFQAGQEDMDSVFEALDEMGL